MNTPPVLLQLVSFVHPALAGAALVGGTIPFVIHLINRRRYQRVPWAAMSFLLSAHRQSAKRVRLEQWLLLLTRIALIVLLGLALARPYVPSSPLVVWGSARSHRILLIDDSLSMSANEGKGGSRFAAARRCAARLLDSFPKTDAVSVVTMSRPARAVVGYASYDRRLVRERVAALRPTQRPDDPTGAIARALKILHDAQLPQANRFVYVVSDFPLRRWLGDAPRAKSGGATTPATPAAVAMRQLAQKLPDPATHLTLIPVARVATANVAVTRLEAESPWASVSMPVRLLMEVYNASDSTSHNLTLQVRRDGNILRRDPLPAISPHGSTLATASVVFATPGTHRLEATVIAEAPDALLMDDTRCLSLEVRKRIHVLLVDGRPGASPLSGETGFLATALAPAASSHAGAWNENVSTMSSDTSIAAKVVSTPELEGEVLSDFDVVTLCNVERVSPSQWDSLGRYVSRGGGLAVFAGALLRVEHYNRYGYAGGKGLLPGSFEEHVADPPHPDAPIMLKPADPPHPIVAEWARQPNSGLFLARIEHYLPLRADANNVEVVLRYTNNDPALVVSHFGQGRVAVFTTTANMAWNNLPAKGDYVSLMVNTVAYLSPRRGTFRNVFVGQTAQQPLTAGEVSLPLHVTTAEGATVPGRVVSDGEQIALAYGPIERSGVFSMAIGSNIQTFCANVDGAESNLETVDRHALAKLVDQPIRVVAADSVTDEPAARAGSVELASVLFYVVTALLVGEMWLAMWFGRRRHG